LPPPVVRFGREELWVSTQPRIEPLYERKRKPSWLRPLGGNGLIRKRIANSIDRLSKAVAPIFRRFPQITLLNRTIFSRATRFS
jgi:hypothetical protein